MNRIVHIAPENTALVKQQPLVEAQGLKKSYALKPILRGINLTLEVGECVALLGANGAGKTTLLRILSGLTKPDAGTISIAGLSSERARHFVGFVAHQSYLYEELTALENLLFFGRMYAVTNVRERALTLLQRVGMEKRRHERVGTLSRGQVQRVAWARALLHVPSLLLLDEPDTGLDQEGHTLIDTLLEEHRQQGGGALFITHQLERAICLSDRVVLLSGGRVVYQHATSEIQLDELRRIYSEVVR